MDGNVALMLATSPFPVTRPIRAHMDRTADIIGKASGIVQSMWKALAKKTYVFLKGNFPAGSEIRRDDVAKGPLLQKYAEILAMMTPGKDEAAN
jgi:hypothetical protein